jgi:hypothetical protein
MSKEQFEGLFGSLIPYRGQVWMVTIPGFSSYTNDFKQFHWLQGRREVSFEEVADKIAKDSPDGQSWERHGHGDVDVDGKIEGECSSSENDCCSMTKLNGFELNWEISQESGWDVGANSDFNSIHLPYHSICEFYDTI